MIYDDVIQGGPKRYESLQYAECTLGTFRKNKDLYLREDVIKFLEITKEMPFELVVGITQESVFLLTDENGNFLEYNFA